MSDLQTIIEDAFERRAEFSPRNVDTQIREAVIETIEQLDQGRLRVAEKKNGQWAVNEWLKKAVLLSFRIEDNRFISGGFTNYFDKVPLKYAEVSTEDFRAGGARVVPPATVRKGACIGGLLQPLQAAPTLTEEDCFSGARSEVVESVIVEQGAVISMGVYIGQS